MLLDPPLIALDKDAPLRYAGKRGTIILPLEHDSFHSHIYALVAMNKALNEKEHFDYCYVMVQDVLCNQFAYGLFMDRVATAASPLSLDLCAFMCFSCIIDSVYCFYPVCLTSYFSHASGNHCKMEDLHKFQNDVSSFLVFLFE